jgi:hypothetical protein
MCLEPKYDRFCLYCVFRLQRYCVPLLQFLLHSFSVSYLPFSDSTYTAFTMAPPSSVVFLLTLRRVSTALYVYAHSLTCSRLRTLQVC